MLRTLFLAGGLVALGLTVSACDSGSGATAQINVRMTDAPFPFDLVDSVGVTITRIEALASEPDEDPENDATDDEGILDRVVLFDGEPFALNLLDLRDGVDTLLVERFSIPADGSYDRLRIFVGDDAMVLFKDGSEYDLKLPSAQQSGIKVALPAYDLSEAGEDDVIDVLVDFNLEESFVTRGTPGSDNFNGFIFKPVLQLESFEILAPAEDAASDESEG